MGNDGRFKIAKVCLNHSHSPKKSCSEKYFTNATEHLADFAKEFAEIGKVKDYKYEKNDAGLIVIPSHRAYHNRD